MSVDFYVVRKGRVDVREFYEAQGIYRYVYGINPRAFAAWIFALAPNLPAFAHAIDAANPDVQPYTYRFRFVSFRSLTVRLLLVTDACFTDSWLFSTVTSAVWYLLINYAFPPKSSLIDEAVYEIYETDLDANSEEGLEGVGEKKPKEADLDAAHAQVVAAL